MNVQDQNTKFANRTKINRVYSHHKLGLVWHCTKLKRNIYLVQMLYASSYYFCIGQMSNCHLKMRLPQSIESEWIKYEAFCSCPTAPFKNISAVL